MPPPTVCWRTARREHELELSDKCGAAVFMAQLEAANDFRTDASLNEYCHADAALYCGDVEPIEGRVQDCLVRGLTVERGVGRGGLACRCPDGRLVRCEPGVRGPRACIPAAWATDRCSECWTRRSESWTAGSVTVAWARLRPANAMGAAAFHAACCGVLNALHDHHVHSHGRFGGLLGPLSELVSGAGSWVARDWGGGGRRGQVTERQRRKRPTREPRGTGLKVISPYTLWVS